MPFCANCGHDFTLEQTALTTGSSTVGAVTKLVRAFVYVASVLLVVGGVYLYVRTNESCAVGAVQTSVSVLVTGAGSNDQCAALVARSGGAGYLYQAGVVLGGPVICQLRVGSNKFTVRDQDPATIVGRAMCGAFATME